MSDTITIRVLGPDDVEVLDRVRPGTFEGALSPVFAWAFLSTGVNAIVVALDQGEVVGHACGTVILYPDKPRAFFLSALGVHPEFRDQDVGQRLLVRLRNVAAERGCEEMQVTIGASDEMARGLYSGLGGAETPDQATYRFDLGEV